MAAITERSQDPPLNKPSHRKSKSWIDGDFTALPPVSRRIFHGYGLQHVFEAAPIFSIVPLTSDRFCRSKCRFLARCIAKFGTAKKLIEFLKANHQGDKFLLVTATTEVTILRLSSRGDGFVLKNRTVFCFSIQILFLHMEY